MANSAHKRTNSHESNVQRPAGLLDREEYIEQAYFFRVYRARIEEKVPSQEILEVVQEEILATTRLPMAIDFLKGEILLTGLLNPGMARLSHYFTGFQTFLIAKAEDDKSQLDYRIALEILQREAEYRADQPTMAGMFVYQFECISRNRLGYDAGMVAVAEDPIYDAKWQKWIRWLRLQLGTRDLADFLYFRSEQYVEDKKRNPTISASDPKNAVTLFGLKEGRIARANRGRDPLYMFAALQRQLGYPTVPRSMRRQQEPVIHPVLEQRLNRIEKRLNLIETESKGGLDLSEFYVNPPKFDDDPASFDG
jgi:hypothetical protein